MNHRLLCEGLGTMWSCSSSKCSNQNSTTFSSKAGVTSSWGLPDGVSRCVMTVAWPVVTDEAGAIEGGKWAEWDVEMIADRWDVETILDEWETDARPSDLLVSPESHAIKRTMEETTMGTNMLGRVAW